MATTKENNNGSELHRLKPMQDVYDVDQFNYLYKISKPVIKRLARQIDPARFNVTRDIIESYFWDKMLYIFNKYYGTCSEEHLKARVLGGLSLFKNHLLHSAYTERAMFNQSLKSFEELFEDSNEDKGFAEEDLEITQTEMFNKIYDYMKSKLSGDGILIFEALYTPPPFIREYPGYKDGNRITNIMLREFFDLPATAKWEKYIRDLRSDVAYWIDRARVELTL